MSAPSVTCAAATSELLTRIDRHAQTLEDLAGLSAPLGAGSVEYLRDHFVRFEETRRRLLRGWSERPRGRMLDVGAHWLHQSLMYAQEGFEVTALDVPTTMDTPEVRTLAQAHGIRLLPNPDLEQPAALAAIPDNTFDVVLLAEVIEHLPFNPVALWREIHRTTRVGGRIVITTPNYYALRSRLQQAMRAIRGLGGGIPVEQILALRTRGHHWKEYSRRELVRYFALLSADFRCVRFAYTQEYWPAAKLRARTRLAILAETLVPPLRPDLYLEVDLVSKDKGITVEPHW